MPQCQDDIKSLYVKFAAARQARTRFVADNRKTVASFLRDASARRVDYHNQIVTRSSKQARDRKRYRDRSRRELMQSLLQTRSERIWGGKRLRRELNTSARDIRWQVERLLRTSCSDRARNERSRIRETSDTLKGIQRSVHRIRSSVRHNINRKSQSLRTREVFS
jgi:predicted transcriptional regulator/DNA-dependent RNA polymerase auxiliary subunit epsilon